MTPAEIALRTAVEKETLLPQEHHKHVVEILAEIDRLREWQPITTAPKDAERLLLAGSEGKAYVGYWRNDCWLTVPGHYLVHPTHWMALPPIPI